MKPETAEWIDKAEGDWKVAQREMQAPDPVRNPVERRRHRDIPVPAPLKVVH